MMNYDEEVLRATIIGVDGGEIEVYRKDAKWHHGQFARVERVQDGKTWQDWLIVRNQAGSQAFAYNCTFLQSVAWYLPG